ncbi:MAG: ABC transporter permease [Planctomycetota bacterium]|nr:MAG: ABC transporter permease [Planctomycetota bacterium]
MNEGESYFDIVWRQFCKNRPAIISLWLLAPTFLLAIFAPLLASNVPFYYRDGSGTIYPWIHALFNPDQTIDFLFNMALVAFGPWVIISLGLNAWWRRRGWKGRTRVFAALGVYVVLTAVCAVLFSFPQLRPDNRYRTRSFAAEQFRAKEKVSALYPPIPFGPTEQYDYAFFKPPMYRKPKVREIEVPDPNDPTKIIKQEKLLWTRSTDAYPHLLGTDNVGRDVFVRMLYGLRVSLTIGFVAVGIYISIGIVLGALAGYFGGAVDILISRLIEVMLLFPTFFLVLTLVGLVGQNIFIIMVVIGLTGWPTIARLIRGEVLKQRSIDYVQAARALGASHSRIIFRHILPNALSPAMVAAPFGIAGAIITEAGLSLLGFGVAPPAPSWGVLLRLGNENYHYWWLVVFPSLAIFYTVTVFNLVGSGLRDAMDPRLRR